MRGLMGPVLGVVLAVTFAAPLAAQTLERVREAGEFKIGYRDTLVSGKLGFLPAHLLVVIEWLLGFYVLACLTITLANTWPLVNRLISGVF